MFNICVLPGCATAFVVSSVIHFFPAVWALFGIFTFQIIAPDSARESFLTARIGTFYSMAHN